MDIPGSQSDHDQTEKELHRQMRVAVEAYRHAAGEHNRLLHEALGRDWRPDADGHQSLYLAANAERHALHKYVETLQALTQAVMARKPQGATIPEIPKVNDNVLTARELEVVRLIAAGLSSRAISDELGISFKTVVVHRYNIMRKLDVHDVVSLVRYAVRKKLVKL
jgi:DNA-binding NarL/FixJ family response regulator